MDARRDLHALLQHPRRSGFPCRSVIEQGQGNRLCGSGPAHGQHHAGGRLRVLAMRVGAVAVSLRSVSMTIRIARFFPGIAGLLLVMGSAMAADTGDLKNGKLVYERYCMSCHGDQGNGQGEAAEYMSIKPRDYRQGTYKWRSKTSGSLPLDSHLEHTLLNGLYGTYMPTWKVLDERSRRDVIAYIKTFSSRFATEKPQDTIVIPPDPGYSDASVTRGAAVYAKNNCSQCHGAGGHGAGTSAHA